MPKKITKEIALERVLNKCIEKNYTLVEDFVWIGSAKTYLKLRCNIDGHEWNTTNYNGFVNQNKGCLKCNGTLIPTTEEANQRVLDKCKEKNYTLVEPFDYINAAKTYLKLKCDKGHEWNTTSYSSFININSGCPECGKEKQVNTMIEKYGEAYLHIIPRHNPYTIQFIDDLSEMTGLNFNHAANGGEKKFHKYWVDAYNEEHNIVIEFDEKHHNLQKESDQERQQYIVDNFGCKFVRVDWEQFIKNPEGEMELLVECVKNISSIV